MPTFSQGSITEQILGGGGQRLDPIPNNPESGALPPNPTELVLAVPPSPLQTGNSCVTRTMFCQRMQYAEFKGPASSIQYPYVLMDTVPAGKYRIIYKLTGLMEDPQNEGTPDVHAYSLWLIPPGPLPQAHTTHDPFFQDLVGGGALNRPPLAAGLRVDEVLQIPQAADGNGIEVPLISGLATLIVPSQWTVMLLVPPVDGVVFGNTPGPNVRLRAMYVDMSNGEELTFDL